MEVAEEDVATAGSQLVAKSAVKNAAPIPKAGLVAVAEQEPLAEPVLVVGPTADAAPRFRARPPYPQDQQRQCFWCHGSGHFWRECPVRAKDAKANQAKN